MGDARRRGAKTTAFVRKPLNLLDFLQRAVQVRSNVVVNGDSFDHAPHRATWISRSRVFALVHHIDQISIDVPLAGRYRNPVSRLCARDPNSVSADIHFLIRSGEMPSLDRQALATYIALHVRHRDRRGADIAWLPSLHVAATYGARHVSASRVFLHISQRPVAKYGTRGLDCEITRVNYRKNLVPVSSHRRWRHAGGKLLEFYLYGQYYRIRRL